MQLHGQGQTENIGVLFIMRDKSRINTVLLTMILAVLCFCAVILAYKAQPGQNKLSAKDTSSPYDDAQYCYEQVRERTDFVPEIALVLGSGLGDFADNIDVQGEISYKDIDGFPVSTAPGHEGKFVYGTLGGKNVICMKGRIHMYEGYSAADAVLPLRVMEKMGAKTIILTNAAGGLNESFEIGDLMLLTDHISFFVDNPLRGANDEETGTRFPDMSTAYDPELNDIIRQSAKNLGIDLQEGVYVQTPGPSYETSAECAMLRQLGADAVGMSTVVESIAANHAGMRVCAISCITNMSYDISGVAPSEEDVIEAGKKSSEEFSGLVIDVVESM